MVNIQGAKPVQLVDSLGNTYSAAGGTLTSPLPAGTNTIGNVGVVGTVATNAGSAVSINAASAIASGTALVSTSAHRTHTLQVDISTTTAATAGSNTVILQGSLDGTNWTALATLNLASTSTTSTDASNHGSASVNGYAFTRIRAVWSAAATTWVGTLTATIASA